MNKLVPFQKNTPADQFQVLAGLIAKSPFEIHLEFCIEGPLHLLLCPPPQEPARQDELWKSTCLEAFLGYKDGSYLEINCSPNGHWNVYEFDSYRKGMRPADHITVRLTRLEKDEHQAKFFIQVLSDKALSVSQAGLSMVFESTNHEKSYWALSHPSTQADFHDSKAWTLSATH